MLCSKSRKIRCFINASLITSVTIFSALLAEEASEPKVEVYKVPYRTFYVFPKGSLRADQPVFIGISDGSHVLSDVAIPNGQSSRTKERAIEQKEIDIPRIGNVGVHSKIVHIEQMRLILYSYSDYSSVSNQPLPVTIQEVLWDTGLYKPTLVTSEVRLYAHNSAAYKKASAKGLIPTETNKIISREPIQGDDFDGQKILKPDLLLEPSAAYKKIVGNVGDVYHARNSKRLKDFNFDTSFVEPEAPPAPSELEDLKAKVESLLQRVAALEKLALQNPPQGSDKDSASQEQEASDSVEAENFLDQ